MKLKSEVWNPSLGSKCILAPKLCRKIHTDNYVITSVNPMRMDSPFWLCCSFLIPMYEVPGDLYISGESPRNRNRDTFTLSHFSRESPFIKVKVSGTVPHRGLSLRGEANHVSELNATSPSRRPARINVAPTATNQSGRTDSGGIVRLVDFVVCLLLVAARVCYCSTSWIDHRPMIGKKPEGLSAYPVPLMSCQKGRGTGDADCQGGERGGGLDPGWRAEARREARVAGSLILILILLQSQSLARSVPFSPSLSFFSPS